MTYDARTENAEANLKSLKKALQHLYEAEKATLEFYVEPDNSRAFNIARNKITDARIYVQASVLLREAESMRRKKDTGGEEYE